MKWEYSFMSGSVWGCGWDRGTIEADNYDQAQAFAEDRVKEAMEKINEALKYCDNTKGLTIEVDLACIIVKQLKEE